MAFHPPLRSVDAVKYWVIFRVHPQKVIAKERTSDPNKITEVIEGPLEDVRVRLRAMRFIYRIVCDAIPEAVHERIIEIWY
jgi:hypothetical protein